jgi:hypothetical protein
MRVQAAQAAMADAEEARTFYPRTECYDDHHILTVLGSATPGYQRFQPNFKYSNGAPVLWIGQII